jgi:hypothetical protein
MHICNDYPQGFNYLLKISYNIFYIRKNQKILVIQVSKQLQHYSTSLYINSRPNCIYVFTQWFCKITFTNHVIFCKIMFSLLFVIYKIIKLWDILHKDMYSATLKSQDSSS